MNWVDKTDSVGPFFTLAVRDSYASASVFLDGTGVLWAEATDRNGKEENTQVATVEEGKRWAEAKLVEMEMACA